MTEFLHLELGMPRLDLARHANAPNWRDTLEALSDYRLPPESQRQGNHQPIEAASQKQHQR
jgi:hypothetical protein